MNLDLNMNLTPPIWKLKLNLIRNLINKSDFWFQIGTFEICQEPNQNFYSTISDHHPSRNLPWASALPPTFPVLWPQRLCQRDQRSWILPSKKPSSGSQPNSIFCFQRHLKQNEVLNQYFIFDFNKLLMNLIWRIE